MPSCLKFVIIGMHLVDMGGGERGERGEKGRERGTAKGEWEQALSKQSMGEEKDREIH